MGVIGQKCVFPLRTHTHISYNNSTKPDENIISSDEQIEFPLSPSVILYSIGKIELMSNFMLRCCSLCMYKFFDQGR